MPSLAERQHGFARAILDVTLPVPMGLAGPVGSVRDERFAVYRNNVAVGLIEALRSSFPVVERLVGFEFFDAMARAHALRSPPSSAVLLAYGSSFPDFIARFEPAAALPYLADVARLEWGWLEAYHAAEAEPVAIADLHSVARDRLPTLRLKLHPSVRVLSLAHPVLRIWRAHLEAGEPDLIELDEAREAVLLVRPHALVQAIELSAGAVAFLEAVRVDRTVSEAAMSALNAQPDLDLTRLFRLLFSAGAFAGFADSQEPIALAVGDDE
ncbi:MAG: DNA-binding domain-containing protein [Gammaproteobacteria bacterium]